jgi:hypothetical protein
METNMAEDKSNIARENKKLERVAFESAYRKPQEHDTIPLSSFRLQGTLKPGERTDYSVDGEDFEITRETWIMGELTYGSAVQVKGIFKPGIGRFATKITVVVY